MCENEPNVTWWSDKVVYRPFSSVFEGVTFGCLLLTLIGICLWPPGLSDSHVFCQATSESWEWNFGTWRRSPLRYKWRGFGLHRQFYFCERFKSSFAFLTRNSTSLALARR